MEPPARGSQPLHRYILTWPCSRCLHLCDDKCSLTAVLSSDAAEAHPRQSAQMTPSIVMTSRCAELSFHPPFK
eukprot:scaffold1878_cov258-Pinguiococcus_pyrenoidosus.AAC.12